MAELKARGLKKSVGTAGLFATAYGNVGSSIYYALGLVAARAAKLVGPDATVEAVYVLKVPEQLPLGGGLGKEEREARRVLEVARMQAKVAGCRVRCRLLRTRNPGRAIVDEAKERRSDLIYISTEHAPSEERLIGPTIRYVMANRPG